MHTSDLCTCVKAAPKASCLECDIHAPRALPLQHALFYLWLPCCEQQLSQKCEFYHMMHHFLIRTPSAKSGISRHRHVLHTLPSQALVREFAGLDDIIIADFKCIQAWSGETSL